MEVAVEHKRYQQRTVSPPKGLNARRHVLRGTVLLGHIAYPGLDIGVAPTQVDRLSGMALGSDHIQTRIECAILHLVIEAATVGMVDPDEWDRDQGWEPRALERRR